MQPFVIYRGVKFTKHKHQPYFYCGQGSKRDSRSLHQQMWIDVHGPIPKGHCIHHIDHDSGNNVIENFACIESREHQRHHMRIRVKENPEFFTRLAELGRPNAALWHSTPEGIAWHNQHAKNIGFGKRTFGDRPCEVCGKVTTAGSSRARFCSNNCKSENRRRSGVDKVERQCSLCGATFNVDRYAPTRFCSRTCSKTNYWRLRSEREASRDA